MLRSACVSICAAGGNLIARFTTLPGKPSRCDGAGPRAWVKLWLGNRSDLTVRDASVAKPSAGPSYFDRLLEQLDSIQSRFVESLRQSETYYSNPNRGGYSSVYVVGAADYSWRQSTPELEALRMELLRDTRDWRTRFQLLFPHPTPQVKKRHDHVFSHFERWLTRPEEYDHSLTASVDPMIDALNDSFATLRHASELLPADEYPVRAVVDTNTMLDNPDVTAWVPALGPKYMAHMIPALLRELDDLKRSGRNEDVRERAKKADRRLKGYRTTGDISKGARVAGGVHVRFDHLEPKADALPTWLDLTVVDDRFIASALLLQSQHPGSTITVVTSDLNLQTKLSAVGLPYLDARDLDPSADDATAS